MRGVRRQKGIREGVPREPKGVSLFLPSLLAGQDRGRGEEEGAAGFLSPLACYSHGSGHPFFLDSCFRGNDTGPS